MLFRKRRLRDPSTQEFVEDEEGNYVVGIELTKNPATPKQTFPLKFINQFRQDLQILPDKIVIETFDGPVTFNIDRSPGCYCAHCGEKLPYEDHALRDSPERGAEARAHVATKHKGKKSPDPAHPAGYHLVTGYETTMEV